MQNGLLLFMFAVLHTAHTVQQIAITVVYVSFAVHQNLHILLCFKETLLQTENALWLMLQAVKYFLFVLLLFSLAVLQMVHTVLQKRFLL